MNPGSPEVDIDLSALQKHRQGVYMLWRRGVIVYVGQSVLLASRIGSHFADKDFDSATIIPVENTEDLDQVELELILLHTPEYNRKLPRNSEWAAWGQALRLIKAIDPGHSSRGNAKPKVDQAVRAGSVKTVAIHRTTVYNIADVLKVLGLVS